MAMSRSILVHAARRLCSATQARTALPLAEAAADRRGQTAVNASARCLVTQSVHAGAYTTPVHTTTGMPWICAPGAPFGTRGFAKGKGKGKNKGDDAGDAGDPAAAVEFDLDAVHADMESTMEHFQHELACIRSGRATPEMLDFIEVEAYGERQPLKAAAATSVRSAQLLVLSVYDPSITDNVIKAIRDSPLQLNPSSQGQEVHVPIPRPTQETIKGLEKLVHKAGESAKVSFRHARHKAIQDAKKAFSSKDDQKRAEKDIQKIVDQASGRVEDIMKHKMKSFHE